MNRPRWFPAILCETEPHDRDVILACQGGWWMWGGSICRKPELCIAARVCYFVQRAAHAPEGIRWIPGFDDEQTALPGWAA